MYSPIIYIFFIHNFQDEYKDEKPENSSNNTGTPKSNNEPNQPSIAEPQQQDASLNLIDTSCLESEQAEGNAGILSDLAGLRLDSDAPAFGVFMPSQLLQVC